MKVKRFVKDLITKPKYRLHISNDYEHVHVYKLKGRKYAYNETLSIDIFKAALLGATMGFRMSNKAKQELIQRHKANVKKASMINEYKKLTRKHSMR